MKELIVSHDHMIWVGEHRKVGVTITNVRTADFFGLKVHIYPFSLPRLTNDERAALHFGNDADVCLWRL